jgi:F-type H+-transporting ATPase subunit a
MFNIIPPGKVIAAVFNIPSAESFEFGIEPPTKNINVTLCLALITMGFSVITEFRFKGVRGWIRSFYKPTPVNIFVKILDYIVRPMSLCLRLFGNILGGYIAMTLAYMAFPLAFPAALSLYFDLFDGFIQAYVFIFLSIIYLSEAAEIPEGVS